MLCEAPRERPTISPAQWTGERDCTIGPFSSKKVALSFVTHVLNVGDSGITSGEIFAKRDAWFVDVLSYLPSPTVQRGHLNRKARRPRRP